MDPLAATAAGIPAPVAPPPATLVPGVAALPPALPGIVDVANPLPALPGGAGGAGLVAFFVVGLLGGAHCLGMCGPLVTTYADRAPSGRDGDAVSPGIVRQQLLFNAGRTVAYAAVGGLLGAAGGALFGGADLAAVGDPVRGAVGVAVGLAVLMVGLGYLTGGAGGGPGRLHDLPFVGAAFGRVHGAIAGRIDRLAAGPGIVALGGLHALLPCPLLYPAYLAAFATGSALVGAASLFALGLGTVPTLLVYGAAIGSLSASSRARLHRALGAAFVLLAAVPLTKGLVALGLPVPSPPLPMPAAPYGGVVP